MSGEDEQGKIVSVSEEYLAFLHDALADNQQRLRELLGDSQSKAIFALSADKLITTVGVGKYSFDPMEGVLKKLTSWGMRVAVKNKGRTTELELRCPHAEYVHPRMSPKEPFITASQPTA